MESERAAMPVLVVSDDAVLGGLIALNLRQRGFLVEQIDLALAQSDRWAPAFGKPNLLILDLEAVDRASADHLRRLTDQPWVRDVPLLVAADARAAIVGRLGRAAGAVIFRPSDVGGIVAAARALLAVPVVV